MVQIAITTGLTSQGLPPQIAAFGANAMVAAIESGTAHDTTVYGGSSSSGVQPTDHSVGQQTRNPEDEVEPKGRRGRPNKK